MLAETDALLSQDNTEQSIVYTCNMCRVAGNNFHYTQHLPRLAPT